MRAIAAVVLLAAGPALADPKPVPPADHPAVAVPAGVAWRAPAGGGVCLDLPAAQYRVERERWLMVRAEAAEKVAEDSFLRGGAWGVGLGVAAGLAAGVFIAGKVKR